MCGLTAVTPTDRPKSVCNRCVIKTFGGVFLCCHNAFSGCRGFCHRTESDLFLFLYIMCNVYVMNFLLQFRPVITISVGRCQPTL